MSAICFPNGMNCLSISALSPLTFVRSEISNLHHIQRIHNDPHSQAEQADIEMKGTGVFPFFYLKDKLAAPTPVPEDREAW